MEIYEISKKKNVYFATESVKNVACNVNQYISIQLQSSSATIELHLLVISSERIIEQVQSGERAREIKVDVRLSAVKPLHAKWVVQFYDYIRSKPDIVINGWKKSKIP